MKFKIILVTLTMSGTAGFVMAQTTPSFSPFNDISLASVKDTPAPKTPAGQVVTVVASGQDASYAKNIQAECYVAAVKIMTGWPNDVRQRAVTLCQGATSLVPVQCYAKAVKKIEGCPNTARDRAVTLCQSAISEAPLQCYDKAIKMIEGFPNDATEQAAELCEKATSDAPTQCYAKVVKEIEGFPNDVVKAAVKLCRP